MLTVNALEIRYQGAVSALRGVDLSVPDGSLVTVLGSNGAGKTTLLRAISNVLPLFGGTVTGGTIEWDGRDTRGVAPHELVRAGIVQAPEGRGIFTSLTVEENLRVGGMVRGRRSASAAIADCLNVFPDLAGRLRTRAGLLSGGQQQMLALARALVARPRLLLLDEPSLGLAPIIVEQVGEIVRRINDEGTTVVLVEQNAALALRLADHAYVLEVGCVRLHGRAADLVNSDEIRRLYLGLHSGQVTHDSVEAAAGGGDGHGNG